MRDTGWMLRAECSKDPKVFDLFFPSQQESSREKYSHARRVCARCPVKSPCAAYAISNDIIHGLWGGMTRGQRKKLTLEEKREIFRLAREEVKGI